MKGLITSQNAFINKAHDQKLGYSLRASLKDRKSELIIWVRTRRADNLAVQARAQLPERSLVQ